MAGDENSTPPTDQSNPDRINRGPIQTCFTTVSGLRLQKMPEKNAIIVALDGLSAAYLGPYGNTWLETPGFNRLAAESLLIQNALADSADLSLIYQSLWTGSHAASPPSASGLPAQLAKLGVPTGLMSDDQQVVELADQLGFSQLQLLPRPATSSQAKTVAETRLAEMLASAVQWIEQELSPEKSRQLFWLHAGTLAHGWDAPLELRQQLADEDDPDVPTITDAPSLSSPTPLDPDTVLGYSQAYGGEIQSLDQGLDWLLDQLDQNASLADSLLVVMAPRGFPLGIHGDVGLQQGQLYADLLHVPMLIRFPQHRHDAQRDYRFFQPLDIHHLLAEWFGVENRQPARLTATPTPNNIPDEQPYTYSIGPDQSAIRTPAWYYRRLGQDQVELFAKPDDAWELNEVADLRLDVVEQLTLFDDQLQAYYQSPDSTPPPLPELLADAWH